MRLSDSAFAWSGSIGRSCTEDEPARLGVDSRRRFCGGTEPGVRHRAEVKEGDRGGDCDGVMGAVVVGSGFDL